LNGEKKRTGDWFGREGRENYDEKKKKSNKE